MLSLTDNVVKRFREFLKTENAKNAGIRIYVTEDDISFEKDGLKVFLEQKANTMLYNATLDFAENQGFIVTGVS